MEQELELKLQTRNEGHKARAWAGVLETAKEQIWTEMKGKSGNNRLMGLEMGKELSLAATR